MFKKSSGKEKTTIIDDKQIWNSICESMTLNFGETGAAHMLTGVYVKYWNPDTCICIIGCPFEKYRMVWYAMTFITRISLRDVIIRVLHLGGTVRACKKAAINYDRVLLDALIETEVDKEFYESATHKENCSPLGRGTRTPGQQ